MVKNLVLSTGDLSDFHTWHVCVGCQRRGATTATMATFLRHKPTGGCMAATHTRKGSQPPVARSCNSWTQERIQLRRKCVSSKGFVSRFQGFKAAIPSLLILDPTEAHSTICLQCCLQRHSTVIHWSTISLHESWTVLAIVAAIGVEPMAWRVEFSEMGPLGSWYIWVRKRWHLKILGLPLKVLQSNGGFEVPKLYRISIWAGRNTLLEGGEWHALHLDTSLGNEQFPWLRTLSHCTRALYFMGEDHEMMSGSEKHWTPQLSVTTDPGHPGKWAITLLLTGSNSSHLPFFSRVVVNLLVAITYPLAIPPAT